MRAAYRHTMRLLAIALVGALVSACGGEEPPGTSAPATSGAPSPSAAASAPTATAASATAAASPTASTATAAPPTAAATAAAAPTPALAATAPPAAAGPQLIALTAVEDGNRYSFTPVPATLRPGDLTVRLTNRAGNEREHNLAIRASNGTELGRSTRVDVGQTEDVKFTLPQPGTYELLCVVQGHADRGQRYTITVTGG